MLQGNIGIVFEEQGKLDNAEQMYNESLRINVKVFGEGSLDAVDMQKNIADVREAQGRYDEAVAIYTSVLQIQERLLGRNDLNIAETQSSIAIIFSKQGKHTEALKLWKKELAIKEKVLGRDHPDTVAVQKYIAKTYYNIACAHSCAGSILDALANLDSAASAGLSKAVPMSHIESDTDLDNVRQHAQFQQILGRM